MASFEEPKTLTLDFFKAALSSGAQQSGVPGSDQQGWYEILVRQPARRRGRKPIPMGFAFSYWNGSVFSDVVDANATCDEAVLAANTAFPDETLVYLGYYKQSSGYAWWLGTKNLPAGNVDVDASATTLQNNRIASLLVQQGFDAFVLPG